MNKESFKSAIEMRYDIEVDSIYGAEHISYKDEKERNLAWSTIKKKFKEQEIDKTEEDAFWICKDNVRIEKRQRVQEQDIIVWNEGGNIYYSETIKQQVIEELKKIKSN